MKEYKGIVPENLMAYLGKIKLRHLFSGHNCIIGDLAQGQCHNTADVCRTCLLVHPSWRSEIDAGMRDSLVEYLVDNNYLSAADALRYTLDKLRTIH